MKRISAPLNLLRVRPRLGIHFAPVLLTIFCCLLFFQGISSRGLWASHEARAAQNAQGMLDEGHWLLPRLFDGQVELQKPPGFYWLIAGVGSLRGGVDSWAVRLPSIVAGLGTVLLVWWHLHRRGRPVAGLLAGVMLAGAVHFTGTARIGRIDVPLACVVAAMVLVSRDALAEREPSRSASASRLRVLLIGGLAGFALLLKGPIGVALPFVAIVASMLIERRPLRPVIKPVLAVGLIALAIALPWYLWANVATDGEFFRVFILYHHFNRAFGGAESLAGHPFWFYLPRFAADFLPWTPLLLIALIQRRWRGDSDARFGLVWFAVMVVVLSLSRFKRADYLLPAYSGAAIFLGCAVERWYCTRSLAGQRKLQIGLVCILAFLPLGWFAFDHAVTAKEEAARDTTAFASTIRDNTPAPITLFRVESHQLAYQLGRPIHTLVEWADLNAQLREPGLHFVVTRAEFLDEVRQHACLAPEVVARSEPGLHRPLILIRFSGKTWPNIPKD